MRSGRTFRFGAAIAEAASGRAWREQAKRIEDVGYSTLLIPDHFVTDFSPVPALAAAAGATTTLRVGTMVFDNDFRHPAVLAKDAATLDVMTDGRFELGIGAGWHREEYAAAGIPFDDPRIRVARLEESVAIIKGLWRSEPFSFAGDHYRISEMTGLPRPVQQPHPPVMIGGGGRRLLRLAGREANIVSFAAHVLPDGSFDVTSLTAEGVAQRIEWIRDAAGDRFAEIELSNYYSTPAILDPDRESAAERVLGRLRERFGDVRSSIEDVFASPHYLFGDAETMIDVLVERRERFGASYIVFTDDVESYSDVVRALAGT